MANIFFLFGKLIGLFFSPFILILEKCVRYIRTGYIGAKLKFIGVNSSFGESSVIVGGDTYRLVINVLLEEE